MFSNLRFASVFLNIWFLILSGLSGFVYGTEKCPERSVNDKLTGIERRHGHYFMYGPVEYARRVVSEGSETVTIGLMDGKGRSCYDSQYMPLFGRLEGGYVERLIGELQKRDVRTYGWVVLNTQDLHEEEDFIYDEMYPGWVMEFMPADEKQREVKGMCVVSSPYIQRHAKVLRECAALGLDGYFFDGFYLMGIPHPGEPGCLCDYCRRAFRDETGHLLPEKVDWDDMSFKKWVRWRNEKLLEVARYYKGQMLEVNAGANLRFNFNTWPFAGKDWETALPLWKVDDLGVSQHAFSKRFFEKLMMLGYKCRLSFDMNPVNCDVWRHFRQADTCGGTEFDPAWHELEMRLFMLAGVSYGVVPWRASGNDVPDAEGILRRVNAEVQAKEKYFAKDFIASVAVLNSQNTYDFYGHRDLPGSIDQARETVIGAWMVLTENHLPFRFVFDNELEGGIDREIGTLVMPETAAVSDVVMENVAQWVKKGGRLVASGAAGLCDQWGTRRRQGALEDYFGIDVSKGDAEVLFGRGKVSYIKDNVWVEYCRHRDQKAERTVLQAIGKGRQVYAVDGPSHLITNAFYTDGREKVYLHLLNVSVLMKDGANLYRGRKAGPNIGDINFQVTDGGSRRIGYPITAAKDIRVKFNAAKVRSAKMVSTGKKVNVESDGFSVDLPGLHDVVEITLY